jgi:hypothetical protein
MRRVCRSLTNFLQVITAYLHHLKVAYLHHVAAYLHHVQISLFPTLTIKTLPLTPAPQAPGWGW